MESRARAVWGKRLYSRLPLVGGWMRLRAVRKLAEDDSPEAVRLLAEAVARGGDRRVWVEALEVLQEVERPRCVEAVCEVWARTRNVYLEELLTVRGWAAQAPPAVRVLYQLVRGHEGEAASGGAEVIEPLLHYASDADAAVARRARAALERLENEEAREALCRRVIDRDDALAREVAATAGYSPREPGPRALFYFLTGQFEAYESLDFDRSLLRAVYQAADAPLRLRIAERARAAGRVDWVEVVTGGRQTVRLAEMTDAEWQATLDVLAGRRQWAELWRLAQEAPARWAARSLQRLESLDGLTPERAGLEELVRLARAWQEPSLASLLRPQPLGGEAPAGAHALAISPDSRLLAAADHEGVVRLWSLPDGRFLRRLETDGLAIRLAFSPQGRLLLGGDLQGAVRFWALPDGAPLAVPASACHAGGVTGLEVSPRGKVVASAGLDRRIILWDLTSRLPRRVLPYDGGTMDLMAASPDGHSLVSGGLHLDETLGSVLALWNLTVNPPRHARHDIHTAELCLAMSPTGELLATNGPNGDILLWSLPEGAPARTLKGHVGPVFCLGADPAGRFLASGGLDTTVRLWSLPDGQPLQTLAGHIRPIRSVQFSPDGQVLVSTSDDDAVEFWAVPDGRPLRTVQGDKRTTGHLAASPDGLVLAAWGEGGVQVWVAELSRLSRIPVAQLSPQELDWMGETLAGAKMSPAERQALELVAALARWRRRYDIQLDEAARHVEAGEFDILIAG